MWFSCMGDRFTFTHDSLAPSTSRFPNPAHAKRELDARKGKAARRGKVEGMGHEELATPTTFIYKLYACQKDSSYQMTQFTLIIKEQSY